MSNSVSTNSQGMVNVTTRDGGEIVVGPNMGCRSQEYGLTWLFMHYIYYMYIDIFEFKRFFLLFSFFFCLSIFRCVIFYEWIKMSCQRFWIMDDCFNYRILQTPQLWCNFNFYVQVTSGTDPYVIREKLRDALPNAPKKQLVRNN